MEGFIIKNISNDYIVKSNNQIYSCKARGKFRKDKITPLVGDYVSFDEVNKYILKIHKRKNFLIRPNVSNIDNALIVTSVKDPNLDTFLLDKLLTIISYNNITPIICFTKLDKLTDAELEEVEKYIDYYKKIGYIVLRNDKLEEFNDIFKNKLTVFTGQSGAGKSSLLNKLDNNLNLKTDEISYALGRGKHTTRHTELYEIMGGYLVDTPGFSQVDFLDMTARDIRDNMNEMFDNLDYCKYRDCMHIKEDGCMVKEKVENKEILPSRYNNYKIFIERCDKK
jgi:ribosome biogenesis GTPase